jgi:hypothetical protein
MEITLKAGDSLNIPEGCKAIIEDDLITIIEEKQEEFKEGDILHSINTNRMLIFKKYRENSKLLFSDYFNNARDSNSDDWFTNKFRLATEDEKQALFDKMKAQGLRWNAEEKKVEKIRWRAEYGCRYYLVTSCLKVGSDIDFRHTGDEERWEFSNYFRTGEQAEEAAKRVKEVLFNYHEEIGE